MNWHKRIAIGTIFALSFNILAPTYIYAAEAAQQTEEPAKKKSNYSWLKGLPKRYFRNWKLKDEQKDLTPDQVQEIIDTSNVETFQGNPVLREEQSTIMRPIKQTSLKVLDGQIGIVRSFLAFNAAKFVKSGFSNDASKQAAIKAKEVVSAMTKTQVKALNNTLKKSGILSRVTQSMSKAGPGIKSFAAKEGNFALMAVISCFIAEGIYHGLDVDQMKDRVVQLNAMQEHNTDNHGLFPNIAAAMVNRNFNSLFNNQFDKFFDRMLKTKGFGGEILRKLDGKFDVVGKKLFKATRLGVTNTQSGPGLAEKLGLVGVGAGTQLTLKGLLKSISTGLAYGLAAQVAIDTVMIGIKGRPNAVLISGNRDKLAARADYNSYRFQRSNSKIKNWFKERSYAVRDLWDGYRREPLTKVLGIASGFVGGYAGSLVAGAVLVGGGIPAMIGGVMISSLFGGIGSFLGTWATRKFERGKGFRNFRRKFVESRLFKAIKKMEIYLSGQIDNEEAKRLAYARSQDFYKLEGKGDKYNQMYLVDEFDNVELYKQGEFIQMKVEENHGEKFDMEAHIRYTLIDLQGDQGSWDMLTNHIYNIGNIQENSGFAVHFVTDDDKVFVENGILISDKKDSNFRVLTNGAIMTPRDDEPEKWGVRGLNVNTDIFLRNSQKRFTWNWDLNVFMSVDKVADANNTLKPLLVVLENDNEELTKGMTVESKLREMLEKSKADGIKKIDKIGEQNENDFFMLMQEKGVQKETVERLVMMERSEWKNVLTGKVERGAESRIESILKTISKMDKAEQIKTLKEELNKPETNTVWDEAAMLINPIQFVAEFAK